MAKAARIFMDFMLSNEEGSLMDVLVHLKEEPEFREAFAAGLADAAEKVSFQGSLLTTAARAMLAPQH